MFTTEPAEETCISSVGSVAIKFSKGDNCQPFDSPTIADLLYVG